MEIKEILSELEYNRGSFPYEAVREAIRQKDKITPELLKILEDANKNIHRLEEQPDYMAHIYAMFLLAQFREKRAYPLIIDLFSHPGETSYNIAGDFITEDLARVLASVCHGETALIEQLVENREADQYVREAGLKALLILVIHGEKPREEILDYYKSLFRGKLERKPSVVWDALVSYCCDLHPGEVYEDIKRAYEESLVDPSFIDLREVERYLKMSQDKAMDRVKSDTHYRFVEDVISEMEWWACFRQQEKVRTIPVEVKSKKSKKVGRNDPCPCGSGKKYKKCCGAVNR